MNHNSSRVQTFPNIKRTLEELRAIQKVRLKTKMTSHVNIGDGTGRMIFANISKLYTGNIRIERIEDNLQLAVHSEGKLQMVLPCDQIKSCSIIKTTVTLQLNEDYYAEKCIFEFYSEEQVEMFRSNLPPIKRPEAEDTVSVVSSDSDFDDSGNEKSSGMNNSFDAANLSEHE